MLPSEQDRPAIARKRERWRRLQTALDPRRLVFIDETWVKTNMVRLRGRALRGQRLNEKVPHDHWKTVTFIGALRSDRIDAPCVLDQPVNRRSFLQYVKQFLVPTLGKGDVVLMDNLNVHKNPEVRRAIRAAGAKLWLLPAYSPDLKPDRAGIRKAEGPAAQGGEAGLRGGLRRDRQIARRVHPTGMCQLREECRLRGCPRPNPRQPRFNLIRKCSSSERPRVRRAAPSRPSKPGCRSPR
ncbi:MAG: IS630 family transposase [Acetobacteraceae bacterium]|nr:IS630 family transposase [Acetobacteraceae bacterium]